MSLGLDVDLTWFTTGLIGVLFDLSVISAGRSFEPLRKESSMDLGFECERWVVAPVEWLMALYDSDLYLVNIRMVGSFGSFAGKVDICSKPVCCGMCANIGVIA